MLKKEEKEEGIMVDGFSSDDEFQQQQIIQEEPQKVQIQTHHKEEVKFKVPPPQQIKQKSYSLHPDIVTGWAPKIQLPVPIPMIFDNRKVDLIVKKFIDKKQQKMKLCYLGPRYENTFYAWHEKDFDFPYSHIRSPLSMKFTNRAFCGQHWDAEDGLIFDSFFQSGNLDCAFRVGEREYDIYIRVDSNTRGHLHWFNFKVKKLEKLQKYRINICNISKNKSLYSRGQKPYIFSKKRNQKQKKGWEQSGQSVKFQQRPGKSTKLLLGEFSCSYKLSFDYYTEYDNDEVQIAYCVPYTYSQLLKHLNSLNKANTQKGFFVMGKLCHSLGGLQIPLITIHEEYSKQMQGKINQNQISKKCIIISGRMHPGESNGSFMMHGFLQFLCGNSKQAKSLRQNFIFKIVPMLNPDGVALGNYRTGISGKDFNREYRNPEKSIFPQVYAFKKLVIDNKILYKQNLLMFLDFHGHSVKKNVFVYGPEFPIIHKHYYQCRVFPKLLGNLTTMFRYYSCSFKVSQFKQTTARAIFLRKLLIPLSYTIQASNGSYYDHQLLKDIPFCAASWIDMGKAVGLSLWEYGDMIIAAEKYKFERMWDRKNKKDGNYAKKLPKAKTANQSTKKDSFSSSYADHISILAIHLKNQKIKKIFQDIKKAEEEKQNEKNEQDLISEGSSDKQDETDDLSHNKLNLLFQIIKNKKSNIPDKYKVKLFEQDIPQTKPSKANSQQNQQKHDYMAMTFELKPAHVQFPIVIDDFKYSGQLSRHLHLKGHLAKSRNNQQQVQSQSERKNQKQKIATKIINFSFVANTRPQNNSHQHRRDINYYKKQLLQAPFRNNGKVLDLSETFRQTFNSSTKQIHQISPSKQVKHPKSPDKKSLTFSNISPRKLGSSRFEDFKYKRLLLDQYKF